MTGIDRNLTTIAKVADFGLACTSAPNTGGTLATWQWHAPEVLSPKERVYDEKIDIYSFAIVMYEIASRKFPFEEYKEDLRFCRIMEDDNGENHYILQEIQLKEAIEYSQLRPSIPHYVPPEFTNLIKQCWSSSPSSRPNFSTIVSKLSDLLQIQNNCNPKVIDLHTFCNPNRFSHAISSLPKHFSLYLENEDKEVLGINNDLLSYSYSVSLPPQCNPLCLIVACGNVWCGCDTGDILIWSAKVIFISSFI